jgi:hypothetical protein
VASDNWLVGALRIESASSVSVDLLLRGRGIERVARCAV